MRGNQIRANPIPAIRCANTGSDERAQSGIGQASRAGPQTTRERSQQMNDAGQFDRWNNEDPPGSTGGTPVQTIDLGIEIVLAFMVITFLAMCFTKKK